jgi:hypothetical protein
MCRVNIAGIEENIYTQITQGNYERDDYILVDKNGEIQAVSGNSDFWENGVVPRKDYIVLKVERFIDVEEGEDS